MFRHCENGHRYQLPDFSQTWLEPHGAAGVKLMTRYKVDGQVFDFWIGHWPYSLTHLQAWLKHRESQLEYIHMQTWRHRERFSGN